MQTISYARAVPTTPRRPITDVQSTDGNEPVEWIPSVFFAYEWTDPGQAAPSPSPEEHWASLSAAARADWAADNQF